MTITAEQEQFINKHSEYADKIYERHANFQSTKRYMAVDEVRALVSQLVPPGSAVVDTDTMSSLIQCAIFVGSFVREPRDSRPVESLAAWARGYVDQLFANQPSLPASPQPVAQDRAEPKCVCEPVEFILRMHTICRTPSYFNGRCIYCGHLRACHTPAPAAKEGD